MKQVDVVGAVIINEQDEVLCALRSQTMSLPGLWEFPGGKIEPNEAPEQSLRREIREELDCDIQVGAMVADTTHQYPNLIVRLMTFYATVIQGQPAPSEHEKLVWLPRTQLSELNWAPADIPTVDKLIADTKAS
jgi:8-oxo-dGTP diphosphatase